MAERFSSQMLELPQNVRENVLGTLVAAQLLEQGLEKGIQFLYHFLLGYIPFSQMVYYSVDTQRQLLTPWVVLEEGQVVPIYEPKPIVPLSSITRVLESEEIFLENDSINSQVYAASEWFLSGKRSVMALTLHKGERFIFGMNLNSTKVGQFTREHAAIVNLLRAPLAQLISSFFYNTPQYSPPPETLRSSLELLRQCHGLSEVVRQIETVAPTESLSLILGETGVGKELVADSIHRLSGRADGPLVKVNCASMTETLIDSELFGHEKGSFTGATALHQGYFEQAEHGTLFLDEVGELSLSAQARLLRVIETRELQRVGGQRRVPVDVRVVAATNQDLPAMVEAGTFRRDLWFRLLVFPITVPPLRQRREDIASLALYAYNLKIKELKLKKPPRLDRHALGELYAYSWPGNVRELLYLMERALLLAHSRGQHVLTFEMPAPLASGAQAVTPPASLDGQTARLIRETLEQCGGRLQGPGGAAESLGLHPSTLRGKMRKLGIAKNG